MLVEDIAEMPGVMAVFPSSLVEYVDPAPSRGVALRLFLIPNAYTRAHLAASSPTTSVSAASSPLAARGC